MINWLKNIFRSKQQYGTQLAALPKLIKRWHLVFIMGEKKERIDLGVFDGTRDEAIKECYGRQMIWFFGSGIRHAIFGTYGVEQIED